MGSSTHHGATLQNGCDLEAPTPTGAIGCPAASRAHMVAGSMKRAAHFLLMAPLPLLPSARAVRTSGYHTHPQTEGLNSTNKAQCPPEPLLNKTRWPPHASASTGVFCCRDMLQVLVNREQRLPKEKHRPAQGLQPLTQSEDL